jgi:hypothetical protein
VASNLIPISCYTTQDTSSIQSTYGTESQRCNSSIAQSLISTSRPISVLPRGPSPSFGSTLDRLSSGAVLGLSMELTCSSNERNKLNIVFPSRFLGSMRAAKQAFQSFFHTMLSGSALHLVTYSLASLARHFSKYSSSSDGIPSSSRGPSSTYVPCIMQTCNRRSVL